MSKFDLNKLKKTHAVDPDVQEQEQAETMPAMTGQHQRKGRPLTVYLTDALTKKLEQRARKTGLTKKDITADAVAEYLQRHQTARPEAYDIKDARSKARSKARKKAGKKPRRK